MIYLAGPYSHLDPTVMEERFNALTKKASELINDGQLVYSPITHNHPIAVAHGLPSGWEFWEAFDTCFVSKATQVLVLMLPGWEQSTGVKAEVALAIGLNIPVTYITP